MKADRALLGLGLAAALAGASCTDESSPLNVVPGAPAFTAVVRGADQTAQVATALPEPIVVKVTDRFGNPVPGVDVRFDVTAGGGSVSAASGITNNAGEAQTVWTLGTKAGANVLTATVSEARAATLTFTATATPGPPAKVLKTAGDNQVAEVGSVLPTELAATVTDRFDNPVPDVIVSWLVLSGGGTVSPSSSSTRADGLARTRWTLGSQVGVQTVEARPSAAGVAAVQFSATALEPANNYDLELRFLNAPTDGQRQAFSAAEARWEGVITTDISDLPVNVSAGACFGNQPALNETVDDMIVFVELVDIDGPGGVLGAAGPCFVRTSNNLPVVGRVRLDRADLATLEQNGRLRDVILHEVGHTLGIGTLWQRAGLLAGAGGSDPFFTGASARQAFLDVGGASYSGAHVPVENTGGAGTRDSHWRESVMTNELMTGFIAGLPNPLSIVTIGSLGDLGYAVSFAAADNFGLSAAPSAARTVLRPIDIALPPVGVVDESGRVRPLRR